jgi:hypothetical protein
MGNKTFLDEETIKLIEKKLIVWLQDKGHDEVHDNEYRVYLHGLKWGCDDILFIETSKDVKGNGILEIFVSNSDDTKQMFVDFKSVDIVLASNIYKQVFSKFGEYGEKARYYIAKIESLYKNGYNVSSDFCIKELADYVVVTPNPTKKCVKQICSVTITMWKGACEGTYIATYLGKNPYHAVELHTLDLNTLIEIYHAMKPTQMLK